MDILKAFSLQNGDTLDVNIQGTLEKPLFQANQIGRLLGMTNIHKTIGAYSEDMKVFPKFYTPGGTQQTAFLTESGLYRLLARSNKPIAEKFQTWMVDVLVEIRRTGEYKLKQQLEIFAPRVAPHVYINLLEIHLIRTLQHFSQFWWVLQWNYNCTMAMNRYQSNDKMI